MLSAYNPDLILVVAFGEIIKENVLSIPSMGCINIHASLLPKYRGAAPIQRCLMSGETESGVTIIEMVLKMDAGDIIGVLKTPVPENMTFGELEAKLCELSCSAVTKAIDDFEKNTVVKIPQNEQLATFAPKITPQEEEIQWTKDAMSIHNLIRALSPYPGAWCYIKIGKDRKRIKIKRSEVENNLTGDPGAILNFNKDGWIVACGNKALKLLEVQLEGKKMMKSEDFIKGVRQSVSFV